jgi:hypothetical protein
MALQNSIYAPTPFSVANGGTGNSTNLATNQVWLGNGTATPAITTLTAGTNITFTPGSGILTIAATAATPLAIVLPNPTVSQTLTANTYIATNTSGGITTFTLPTSPTPGESYRIIGSGTQGWKVAQNAGQQITFGALTTTTGTGGSIASQTSADGITIYCQTTTTFIVDPAQGTLTVT